MPNLHPSLLEPGVPWFSYERIALEKENIEA
jgi:hypothetical protein